MHNKATQTVATILHSKILSRNKNYILKIAKGVKLFATILFIHIEVIGVQNEFLTNIGI